MSAPLLEGILKQDLIYHIYFCLLRKSETTLFAPIDRISPTTGTRTVLVLGYSIHLFSLLAKFGNNALGRDIEERRGGVLLEG